MARDFRRRLSGRSCSPARARECIAFFAVAAWAEARSRSAREKHPDNRPEEGDVGLISLVYAQPAAMRWVIFVSKCEQEQYKNTFSGCVAELERTCSSARNYSGIQCFADRCLHVPRRGWSTLQW